MPRLARPTSAAGRVLLAAAALALAAGCAGTTAGTGRPAADVTGRPAAPSGGSTAATPSGSPAGQVVRFGRVRMPLTSGTTAKVDGELLCVTLLEDTGCSLEVLDVGRIRARGGSVSTPAPGEPNGWWWGSDEPACGTGADTSPVTTSTVVATGFKKVGPKTARYGSWRISCQNSDLDFDPRLWWLPTSQLAFRARSTAAGAGAAVDTLLAGVTFAG